MVEVMHSSLWSFGYHCDGKPCFEVLLRRKRRGCEVAYWCGQMHAYFDAEKMDAEHCPKRECEMPKVEFNKRPRDGAF